MVGRIVLSKAGRDKGKYFLVTGIAGEEHVYIADGSLRRIEKCKKKKLKHLTFLGKADQSMVSEVDVGGLTNKRIKEIIASNLNRE